MERVVRDRKRRTWTVRSRISWTKPQMADQFEHDVAAGYLEGVWMLVIIVLLTLFVVIRTPDEVVRPAWFVLLILLILLLLPFLWALQRPWIITAETLDPIESAGERWEGVVYGILSARDETARIADELEEKGEPDVVNGPLMRVLPVGRDS
jgi:hypothetical protein